MRARTFCSGSPLQIFMIPRFHFICNSSVHWMIEWLRVRWKCIFLSHSLSLSLTHAGNGLVVLPVSGSLVWLLFEIGIVSEISAPTDWTAIVHARSNTRNCAKMFNYLSATTQALNKKSPTGKKTLYFLAVVQRESTLQANAHTKPTINITCFVLLLLLLCSINVHIMHATMLAISPSAFVYVCAFNVAVAAVVVVLTTQLTLFRNTLLL